MDIRISGRNATITKGVREHLEDKLARLEKYAPRIVEARVILKKEKFLCCAEITLLAKHFRAFGQGSEKENFYTAIDKAYERVQKQLKKFREKIKDHHKDRRTLRVSPKVKSAQTVPGVDGMDVVLPARIAVKPEEVKPMTCEEASLQLELSQEAFFVFLNQETKQPSVVFKRSDGHHGLVAPE